MSERLHYQVPSSPDALLLFWSSESVPDGRDQHVRLTSVEKSHALDFESPNIYQTVPRRECIVGILTKVLLWNR